MKGVIAIMVTRQSEFDRDIRLNLMDSLLSPAQTEASELVTLHSDAIELDAFFYGHLACWYHRHGQVRRFREVFTAGLFSSPFPEHREAGWVLLQTLAPHQVASLVEMAKSGFRKSPRTLRHAVEHYLRAREANPNHFDRAALRQGKALKQLYASLHIRPGQRAQAVLFDREPPEGSLSWKVKQVARCQSPAEQAVRLAELRLPFPVAVGLVRQLTPSVLAALVEVMTPAEVMNHLKMLKARGALEHAELRSLIDHKLSQAKSDSRVSDYRALVAAEVVTDDAMRHQLEQVAQHRLEARGTISRSTAILVDKSSSLSQAIEVGKRVAALAAGLTRAELHVLVFDSLARPLKVEQSGDVADWERAFRGVVANGCTSIGSPVAWLRSNQVRVEQLFIVTDEEENTAPYFVEQLELYQRELGLRTDVVFIKVAGSSEHLERQMRQRHLPFDTYQFTGDYFSLPNLVPMLTRPGRLDLLMEILATELPVRPHLASGGPSPLMSPAC